MRRTSVLTAVALAALLAVAALAPAAVADFDGDGFEDLAVGAPGENSDAGAVNVLYGSGTGLTGANQTVTQANSEAGDSFGTALAKGDFDGDGITDLAVGAAGEGVSGAESAGVVSVYYGTADGLPGSAGQVLFQGNPEDFDLFGDAVAAGRFNADAFDDLAVGASGETVGGDPLAGAVTVFYGSAGGLGASGQAIFQSNPEGGDQFGEELATAPFADGLTPLAVGAPGETVGGAQFAGAVSVFFPSSSGLPAAGDVRLQGSPEEGDLFGSALAGGRFGYTNEPEPDLAVGAPGETIAGRSFAGSVSILVAWGTGGDEIVQGPLAGGNPEAGDQFGFSLASGEFEGGDFADLAIGAPGEDVGAITDTGVVHTMFGQTGGLFGGPFLSQNSQGVPGQAESGDGFGEALATGHYSSTVEVDAELAVGAPGEGVGAGVADGAVVVLRGLDLGGVPDGGQLFTQGRVAGGQPEQLDRFGAALA